MDVGLSIRVSMVQAVLGSPPECAALRGGLCNERKAQLKKTRGAVGSVSEVAMVAGTDGEDPDEIERRRQDGGTPGQSGPEGGETPDMDQHEAEAGGIGDVVWVMPCARGHGAGSLSGSLMLRR